MSGKSRFGAGCLGDQILAEIAQEDWAARAKESPEHCR